MTKTTMSDIYRIAEKINSEGGRVRIEQAGSGGLNLYVDRINPFDGKIEKGYEAFLRGTKKDIYETLIKIRFVPQYRPYAVRSNPDSYEMRELAMFRKQMEETEKLPLAERKANAVEWYKDLSENYMMVAERVGWLLNGSYGKGSFDSACRVLASPRMNQVAWCAITIANLEWRCPAKFAIQAWKKMPVEKRYLANQAIRQAIEDAKREGYCG